MARERRAAVERAGSAVERPGIVAWVLSVPLLLLLAVPVGALVWRTPFARLPEIWGEPAVREAVRLSLVTSVVSLFITIVLGTPLACALAQRGRRRSWVVIAVDALIDLPTILPPAVAGLALLVAFGRMGLTGPALRWMGIEIAFTPIAVVVAQVFVASPYYVRALRASLQSIDADVLESAVIDGASRGRRFWAVAVPLATPGILAGAALCWARALGEFGATILFAGNYPGRTQTMPLAIYMGFEMELDRAIVLSVILLGISVGILACVRVLAWRRSM